jgi:hypothetical protein
VPSSKRESEQEIREAGAPEEANIAAGLPTAAQTRAAGEQESGGPPRFARERLLGPEGQALTGHPPHVLAPALRDVGEDELTRADVDRHVKAFLEHEDTTGRED